MQLLELGDAGSFLKRTNSLFLEKEAENQLLFSSALILARSSAQRNPKLSFFIVESDGRIEAAGLNVAHRRFLLSSSSEQAAEYMGSFLPQDISISCILGPTAGATSLAQGYEAKRSSSFRIHQRHLTLQLTKLASHTQTTGVWRVAKEKDLKLLLDWSFRFVDECNLDEPRQETEEVVRRYIEGRQLFLWEDPHPVAMAGYGGFTPSGVRVNMVYTSPKARALGYGTSLVAAVSRKLLSTGHHKSCFLMVDADNLAAVKVYERLGYSRVSESLELKTQDQGLK